MHRSAAFLSTLTFAAHTFAQEPPTPATADGFAAPNGQLGAGLSISKEGTGRVFGEFSFFSGGLASGFVEADITSLGLVLGGGYKLTPELELDVMLPMAFGTYSVTSDGMSEGDSGIGIANLHVGAHWMKSKDELRYKLGGALEWGPWNSDYDFGPGIGLVYSAAARGAQDAGLWAPETLTILAPARIEYGHRLAFTGDAALAGHIPTDGGDFDFSVLLAPGVAYGVSDSILIGARLPMVFMLTDSSDMAQLGFEPNARFDLGRAFINTRFTLNLDEPLGFSFDEGRVWGLHVGGGGTF
jgi:hypothetical protein